MERFTYNKVKLYEISESVKEWDLRVIIMDNLLPQNL